MPSGRTKRASRSWSSPRTACPWRSPASAGGRAWRSSTSGGAACWQESYAAAVDALGGRLVAAAIGPGIGPCCYDVGDDVADPMRAAFGTGLVREGRLDLPGAVERALRECGLRARGPARRVHRLPSRAVLLPPPRRRADRKAGSDCHHRLTRCAIATSGSSQRWGRRDRRRRDEVRGRRRDGCARRGGRDGRRREPGPGPRGEARRARQRVPLALHRAPPEQEGADGQRAVRALPLARLAVRRAPPRDPGARPGEPRGRGVEVRRGRRRSSTRFLPNAPPRSSGCRRCHRSPTIRRRRGRSFAGCGSSRRLAVSPSCRWGRRRTTASPWTRARRSYAWAQRCFQG